ncbi:DUF6680 family protein [Solidesulfovibrio sp. C21]|uniref:DUF6680 family protein n=1 Tax=Solidesulfovibrio sp. C21 TaxID=3398613 RepID=UPI0039FCB750
MNFDYSTFAIVFATFCGPIAAVQAQKWLERKRESRERKLWIFRNLMMTRATPISPAHVEAINLIPIEFYSKKTASGTLLDKWRKYISHLDSKVEGDAWHENRRHLFTELLQKVSEELGYDFTYDELKRCYYPVGKANVENDNNRIREGLVSLLEGKINLPLSVKDIPVDGRVLKEQDSIRKLITRWLSGDISVGVEIKSDKEVENK